jgi:hypothetical protein
LRRNTLAVLVRTPLLQLARLTAPAIFAAPNPTGQAAVFGQVKRQSQSLAFQGDGHGPAFARRLAHFAVSTIRVIPNGALTFYG